MFIKQKRNLLSSHGNFRGINYNPSNLVSVKKIGTTNWQEQVLVKSKISDLTEQNPRKSWSFKANIRELWQNSRYVFCLAYSKSRFKGCLYEVRHPIWVGYLTWVRFQRNGVFKNKSFIWEWTHPTQVGSHFNAGEISLRWDDFSPCKQFLPGCPT